MVCGPTRRTRACRTNSVQAYKDGLIFVAAIAYRAGPEHVVIARFDHPKFPSDTKRWEAWVDFLDARHERAR